jgi:predicted NBD/HSP70 family sugar kinase
VVNVLDLPTVVLGGQYARLGAWLVESIGSELATRVISRGMASTSVAISAPGAEAAVMGAARSVVDEVVSGGTA